MAIDTAKTFVKGLGMKPVRQPPASIEKVINNTPGLRAGESTGRLRTAREILLGKS